MERTLALIKPDAMHHINDILHVIQVSNFTVIDKLQIQMTLDQAKEFYKEKETQPSYESACVSISSGPVLVMILSHENAVAHWQTILGPTDSTIAAETNPHSIRARFGTDLLKNACHGSDSVTSAFREIGFFFPNATADPLPTSVQVATFLESAVYPVLTKGLLALCTEKPTNPTEWLGHWLLQNNPNKPHITQPSV